MKKNTEDKKKSEEKNIPATVNPSGVPEKKQKKQEEKNLPVKNLPRLFRKKYTEKKFKKKILKKLYIDKDKTYVQSLFADVPGTGKQQRVAVPADTLFTKSEVSRLKILAQQIKKQKGRVRWLPLVACVAAVAVITGCVILFKDILIKKGIKSGLESVFGARCDIAYVHLGILDSEFTVQGLAVADKNNTMTNLFEIERIAMDFDLVQLLKKRFAAEELSVTGVQTGTARQTDGALPPKKQKEEKSEPSRFQQTVTAFASEKINSIQNTVIDMFAAYNPETLLDNFYAQLSSPAVIQKAQTEVETILPAWQNKPAEITASITAAVESGQTAAAFDWQSIQSNPTAIKDGIQLVTDTIENVTQLQKELEGTIEMLQRDAATVQDLSDQARRAVEADYNLVNTEINKITSFTIQDGQDFLTGAFDTVIASLLGKYYPVFQQVLGYIQEYASNAKDKPAQPEEKKPALSRYEGRTIEYRTDRNPSFLIEKMHGSGSSEAFSLDVNISDISNDMDKWGKPVVLQGSVSHGGMSDSFSGTIDTRENRSGGLVDLNYNGSGYGITLSVPDAYDVPGVPKMTGTGNFSAAFTGYEDGSFAVNGSVLMDPAVLTTDSFEPEFAYDLYSRALEKLNSIKAGIAVSYDTSAGLDIGISSDLDTQLSRILSELVNEELAVLKEEASSLVKQTLEENFGSLSDRLEQFNTIKSQITAQKQKLDSFKDELEQKKQEAEKRLKETAESAVKNAAGSAVDSAKDALKGIFGF